MKTVLLFLLPVAALFTHTRIGTESFSEKTSSPLQAITDSYMQLKDSLVADNFAGAQKEAAHFNQLVAEFSADVLPAKEKAKFEKQKPALIKSSNEITNASGIGKARDSFVQLSAAMIELSKTISLADRDVYVLYCPMKKASWLSYESKVRNPYYGKSMLTCGSLSQTIAH